MVQNNLKSEIKNFLDWLCEKHGYCLPPEKADAISNIELVEADQLAGTVLETEGFDPVSADFKKHQKIIHNLFIERFGREYIDQDNIPRDCPVCGLKRAFIEFGSYEICRQCNWEDDPVQYNNPDYEGGANIPSLNQARKEWKTKRIN